MTYHLQDFRVQEDSPESARRLSDSRQATRKLPPGHRSQSEADWAYAKRALARGYSPEEVIRRIADYRADDKADPEYYARLTVTKALVQLRPEILVCRGKTATDIERAEENLRR
jgi:hypothetical protein